MGGGTDSEDSVSANGPSMRVCASSMDALRFSGIFAVVRMCLHRGGAFHFFFGDHP